MVDQDVPHRLGRGPEEVSPVGPLHGVSGEREESLVDQRGGLQRVIHAFAVEVRSGKLAELFVHRRDQFAGVGLHSRADARVKFRDDSGHGFVV